ncbi:unnamed protein product [Paramecium octaurelia]|uniref:Protein kinase domain-containing protein n=1 Tax=Paramecium octaurelia TaxID=43137 RepID=A0A8S1X8K9_PAROT|nr:unnamed protein product [Paramecium octaurelia]
MRTLLCIKHYEVASIKELMSHIKMGTPIVVRKWPKKGLVKPDVIFFWQRCTWGILLQLELFKGFRPYHRYWDQSLSGFYCSQLGQIGPKTLVILINGEIIFKFQKNLLHKDMVFNRISHFIKQKIPNIHFYQQINYTQAIMPEDNVISFRSYVINTNNEIGRGQFGVVYKCQDLDNPQLNLCAKIVNQGLDNDKTKREIDLMKIIMKKARGNKNIVGVEYVDFNDERIILILEKCQCDLQSIINMRKAREGNNFLPKEALNILKQILNGYKFLHDNNIIHRDLKPANILVLDGVYKIADLGLARVIGQNVDMTRVGTPKYIAPQLLLNQTFTNSADIFSLGIITYELIFGGLPYVAHNMIQVRQALRNLENVPVVVNQNHPGMTQDFATLIESMLKFKEEDRISWQQLFSHPLISEENVLVNQARDFQVFINQGDYKLIQGQQKPTESPAKEYQQVPPKTLNQIPIFKALGSSPQLACQPIYPNHTIPPKIQQGTFANPKKFQTVTSPQPNSNPTFLKLTLNTGNSPVANIGQPFLFQQVQAQSDKLYQVGVVVDQALNSLEKFVNLQTQLKQEWFGLRFYLHCYSQCFFEHAKVQKTQSENNNNPQQQMFYTLAKVEQALEKQKKYHQVISQELERHQLHLIYPPMPIVPDFNSYLQKLKFILQTKGLFQYSPDKNYFLEYLQFLYFFERLKEQQEPFEEIYSNISETFKNQRVESFLIDYLNKRYTL